MRVAEFFSGIGGMRLALPFEAEKITAYEISDHCNATYRLNFPEDGENFKIEVHLVEHIKAKDLDGQYDVWTMSPPCQPYTTTHDSKQKDSEDKRSNGFKHLMSLLKEISSPPQYIFLENVKGFYGSEMLKTWKQVLKSCGYTWRQYLVSPFDVGVPNNRTRFYMACERSPRFAGEGELLATGVPARLAAHPALQPLAAFTLTDQELGEDRARALRVDAAMLAKPWAAGLSVVGPHDRTTFCFTSAYGQKIHKSTGSFLLPDAQDPLAEVPLDRTDMTRYAGRLRFFDPRELLNLFGFPPGFRFPEDLGRRHRYKLVGNSVSVPVVRALMRALFRPEDDDPAFFAAAAGGGGGGGGGAGLCQVDRRTGLAVPPTMWWESHCPPTVTASRGVGGGGGSGVAAAGRGEVEGGGGAGESGCWEEEESQPAWPKLLCEEEEDTTKAAVAGEQEEEMPTKRSTAPLLVGGAIFLGAAAAAAGVALMRARRKR